MNKKTPPEDYKEYPVNVMSNYDHEIDKDVARKLQKEKLWAAYPGWNFYGHVWWDKKSKSWCCLVMVYQVHLGTQEAKTLESLMKAVSDEYGYD